MDYGAIIYLAVVTTCIYVYIYIYIYIYTYIYVQSTAGRLRDGGKKRPGHFSSLRKRRKLMVYFIPCERLRDFNKTTRSSAISRAIDGETLN